MELFTKDDVDRVLNNSNNNLNSVVEMITNKLSKDPPPNYYHDRNKYETIYSISDIHADYRTLLRHLHKFRIVNLDEKNPLFNAETLLGKNDKTIYDPKFITDV